MKTDEQIIQLIRHRKFDSVRYACIDRLTLNRIDAQAWAFLGQSMVGLKRGNMARLCFERVSLLDPFANWLPQAWQDAARVPNGMSDKQTLKLLEVESVPVSACILTRDSSRTIRQCIESLMPAVDEIVVVDTGSTDDTIEIVESLGLDVHHFEWVDDFSAARNYAQSLASHDWVIDVDSDEILFTEDVSNIWKVASIYNPSNVSSLRVAIHNTSESQTHVSFMERLHRKGIQWVGRVHEALAVDYSLPAPIRFTHDGYDETVVDTEDKRQRNIHILTASVQSNPDDARARFFLGRDLLTVGEYREAREQFEYVLENFGETMLRGARSQVETKYIHLLIETGEVELAKKISKQMAEQDPNFPDGWGWLAFFESSTTHKQRYIKLLQSYRDGYLLDETILPRITMSQHSHPKP